MKQSVRGRAFGRAAGVGVESASGNPAEAATRHRSGSAWLAFFGAAWSLSAIVCAGLAAVPGYPGDVEHYKYWTRLVTLGGIQAAYSGTYPETYAIYPPVTLYAYQVVGQVYQQLVDPTFDVGRMLASRALTAGIKSVAIGFHLILGLAVFATLRALHPVRTAALGASWYLLNPAVIFDIAYWGQPDAAHSLWAVLAFGLLQTGRWGASWVAAGLAAMTKPQVWALLPLFLCGQFRRYGPLRLLAGLGLAGLTLAAVLLPFIVSGRLGQFMTLPGQMAATMPVASAYAHNLWWLATGGAEPLLFDHERLLGPLSYRQVALGLVGTAGLFVLWLSWRARQGSWFLLAAYQAFGWFCLTTRAHENHAFFVLPLLAVALPAHRWARPLFAAISLTLLLNMLLHDPLLAPRLAAIASADVLWRVQMANALANLLILVAWTIRLLRPPWSRTYPAPRPGDRA